MEECVLASLGSLEEVPAQHEATWCMAWAQVLRRWEEATTEREVERAHKWFFFLPQALLRRPRRDNGKGGGKKGRREVAGRFTSLSAGDWGALVEKWIADMEYDQLRGERRNARRRQRADFQEDNDAEKEKLRRQVVSMITDGQIGRAMTRVTSHGVASAMDPVVQAQLAAKYPPRGHPLPESVVRGQAVDNLRNLRQSLCMLQRGVSPGSGGGRFGDRQ